jgi:hypothetical protein
MMTDRDRRRITAYGIRFVRHIDGGKLLDKQQIECIKSLNVAEENKLTDYKTQVN